MNAKPSLHILFTMDCDPVARHAKSAGLRNWEVGARAIEGFCSYLLNAGYPPTLFLSVGCAEEYPPLLEELADRGAELGLYMHPPDIDDGRYKKHLGGYTSEEQRTIIDMAAERVEAAIDIRPRSFRSGFFSANDATFKVLYELGFRQGSVSTPGRAIPRYNAQWEGAEVDAHYVDPHNRLKAGTLPFLELPVTTDPDRLYRGGLSCELCIETGTFADWHHPIAEQHLQRMAADNVRFRTLCFFTRNHYAYHLDDDRHSTTLEQILDYLDTLQDQYELVPTTPTAAHQRFRLLTAEGTLR